MATAVAPSQQHAAAAPYNLSAYSSTVDSSAGTANALTFSRKPPTQQPTQEIVNGPPGPRCARVVSCSEWRPMNVVQNVSQYRPLGPQSADVHPAALAPAPMSPIMVPPEPRAPLNQQTYFAILRQFNITPPLHIPSSTHLHAAVTAGSSEAVQALLRARHPVDLPAGSRHETPLHLAVMDGHRDIVSLLLGAKADPNALTGFGSSPLHLVAAADYPEVASLLLRAGARANQLNGDGQTALQVALAGGMSRTASVLAHHCGIIR